MDRSALALLAVAAALLAGVGCERAPEPPADVLQAGGGAHWYRGNLHAHTRWSDGTADAAAVARWYRGHGYDFLAITDHDVVPEPARWRTLLATEAAGDDFLLIRGEEVSNLVGEASVHLNALGIAEAVARPGGDDVVAAIERTADAVEALPHPPHAPALVQLNHPNGWYSVTAEHLMRQRGVDVFEVFNAHELSDNGGDGLRGSTERMWDIALAWRLDVLGLPLLYGTASDDSHALPGAAAGTPGRAWVRVLTDRLATGRLLDAIRHGRFYASTGIELERIEMSPARLAVAVAAEPDVDYVIEFIGTRRGFDTRSEAVASASGRPVHGSRRYSAEIGTVFARVEGAQGEYRFGPDDLYVRARVTASRRHPAPSQPLQFEQAWVQPVTGPAGHAPSRPDEPLPEAVPAALHGAAHRFAPIASEVLGPLLGTPTDGCSLGLLANGGGTSTTTFARADRALFGGWIVDPQAEQAPDSLTVVLDGEIDYEAAAGTARARPDVAAAFGKPAFERAGFTVDFSLADVVPGEYRIRLLAHYDARTLACDPGATLRVD